ncbi:MAG: SDR family NAD(P)-dependent oxidoreductase [Verrucomicrobiota bacterium]
MKMKILLTGVSSGIGYYLAKAYLQAGHDVFGISRQIPERLIHYPNFTFTALDLRRFDKVFQTLSQMLNGIGTLDLVILNAGVLGKTGDMRELELSDFFEAMDVNVWANKILLDEMFALNLEIRQVVAISSGAGVMAFRGASPYCLSKAALNMLIDLYAAERPKTHFSSIAPYLANTPMQQLIASFPEDLRFPFFQTLKDAKTNGQMLSPRNAAQSLIQAFALALNQPSGSFINQNSSPNLMKQTPAPQASCEKMRPVLVLAEAS